MKSRRRSAHVHALAETSLESTFDEDKKSPKFDAVMMR
jgi:hypothetical protein